MPEIARPDSKMGSLGAKTMPAPVHPAPGTDTPTNLSAVVAKLNAAFAARPPAVGAESSATALKGPPPSTLIMPRIDGYAVEKVIGRGGMGTVYLARQESLDRPVALKVMSRKWADDPVFLARFTREAFAAAQLNHPNIVQIYDIGVAEGQRYFSMEYVPGKTLSDAIRAGMKLDPETAVGYVLQAARGLKHAHDRGMIHRDIKPDNLLVTPQGLVKVADLGLVKTPDLPAAADRLTAGGPDLPPEMTGVRMALGTPAFMSPEQCRDAAAVDHRADIYSLGCTLYAAVTGQPPFAADTAVEVMTKQAYQPLVPPEEINARVPGPLSAVIQKMMAKHPGDRYPHMGEVVRVLEGWLGVHQAGSFVPREDQIAELENCVRRFNTAPAAVLRTRVLTGLLSGCVFAAIVLMALGRMNWAFGVAGLILQAAAVYFVLSGAGRKTYLFRRAKQFAAGLTVGDWLVTFAALGLFGVVLWMLNLLWVWIGFGLIAAGLAVGLRVLFDRPAEAERFEARAACDKLLRRIRQQGHDEDALRQFVAKFAGRHWEEFFESLFGFEAKLTARALLLRGGYAGEREKFAAWREPVIRFIDGVEKDRRAARDRATLVAVESARLAAAGVGRRTARRQAEQTAELMVRRADAFRSAESKRKLAGLNGANAGSFPNIQSLLAAPPTPAAEPPDAVLFMAWLWTGPHVRGGLAVLFTGLFTAWVAQNGIVDLARAEAANDALAIVGVPTEWTAWVDSINVGWAGVLLLASLFFRGTRMGVFAVAGAAVAVLGHSNGLRAVGPVPAEMVSLIVGTVLSLVGYRFGRR